MKTYLTVVCILSSAFGIWLVLCTVLNAVRFHRINKRGRKHILRDRPLVSVIIPARNEEENLPSLLESMTGQEYDNIEILVADDRSTDRTWEIIREYEAKDTRVHGYRTEKGKYSSHGKMNAMLSLIPHAKGKYLLCTDADTIHGKKSILNALKIMESGHYDILSGFPAEYSSSYAARTITASMVFSNVCIPHFIFNTLHLSSFAIGIGQFIMMKKSSYDEVGGYGKLDGQICDDLGIIKAFMKKRKRYAFTTLSDYVSCRMYETGKDAFRGIERSLAGVFPPSVWMFLFLVVAVMFLLTVSWAPLLTPLYLAYGETKMLALVLIGWLCTFMSWYTAARCLKFRISTSLSGPLTITTICAMYLHSVFTRLRGKKFVWKGDEV